MATKRRKKKAGEDLAPVPERYSGDNVRASWPFATHTMRANLAHCSPDGKDALISAFLWCIDAEHPVHREAFSRRVGYSPNTIYKIYAGKYTHPTSGKRLDVPQDLVTSVKAFLALERERFLGGKNEFVLTPTAKRIFNACNLARESRTPVFVSGPSHIGKTMALTQYAQDNNHGRTTYCRMKAASGLGGMVRRMCSRLGVSPQSNTAQLTDYLKNAITVDMVLLLDEVHLLWYTYRRQSFFGCMEVIREILDETGCGMVLSGTLLMIEKVREGEHQEMEQILRRGVHRVRLANMPTKGDLSAIFERWKLDFPERKSIVDVAGTHEKPYEIVRSLAKRSGLKAITERLRYGRKLAAKRKQRLSWAHVIEAHLIIESEAEPEADWS